jgi:hypothetical protein
LLVLSRCDSDAVAAALHLIFFSNRVPDAETHTNRHFLPLTAAERINSPKIHRAAYIHGMPERPPAGIEPGKITIDGTTKSRNKSG